MRKTQSTKHSIRIPKQTVLICTLLALLSSTVLTEVNHYEVLGVSKRATKKQIKKAYKKLIVKFHPDRNKKREKWAKNQFIKVSTAYDILSDPEKRKIYDQFGDEGIKNFEQHGNAHGAGGGGFGGFGGGGGMNIEDIIGAFFGGGGGGGSGRRQGRQQRRRRDQGQRQRQRQRRRQYQENSQYGHSSDGFEFRSGDDGEDFGEQQKETKKVLEHEHFIQIESEDMLPDFDTLTDSYGLFMYKPKHVSQKRRQQSRSGKSGLVMAEKLQNFIEKFGAFLKVGLLNCETFEVACQRLHTKIGIRDQNAPNYTVFGEQGKFRTLNLDRPDLNLNRIVGTHVSLMKKNVFRLNETNIADFFNKNVNKHIVTLFTNKPKPSLLFLTLANIFKDQYIFTEIHVSQKILLKDFKVNANDVPKLMVLKDPSTFEGYFYEGELKTKLLIIFLSQKLKQLKQDNKKVAVYNRTTLASGQCGPKDSTFCLMVLSNSSKNVKWLVERLTKIGKAYASDPLKIFVFEDQQKFAKVFGDSKIVFMKGKRRKFKGKEEGLWQIEDQQLKNFIDMGMSGGMLQGRFKSLEDLF